VRLAAIAPLATLLAVVSPTCTVGPAIEIVPGLARVAPGGTQVFTARVVGADPADVSWWVEGEGSIDRHGWYHAPYVVPRRVIATVRAGLRDRMKRTVVDHATVLLVAGALPGADSCVGVGQGGIPDFGEYVYVDELPEAIVQVAPVYPDAAREAGVEGTVLVRALVCRSGRVLDVTIMRSIPMLDAAAVDAVRQWVFKPALAQGEAVAVWVAVPVRFTLD
jgi:protein TonB